MSLEADLTARLKAAMKAKDRPTLDVIRMVRSLVMEAKTAKGFSGEVDDALHQKVIASYSKQLKNSLKEYAKQPDQAAEMAEKLKFEVDYLSQFLPKKLDEAATQALVDKYVAETGATEPKHMGKVMGALMGKHKDEVEAGLVNRLLKAKLTPQ